MARRRNDRRNGGKEKGRGSPDAAGPKLKRRRRGRVSAVPLEPEASGGRAPGEDHDGRQQPQELASPPAESSAAEEGHETSVDQRDTGDRHEREAAPRAPRLSRTSRRRAPSLALVTKRDDDVTVPEPDDAGLDDGIDPADEPRRDSGERARAPRSGDDDEACESRLADAGARREKTRAGPLLLAVAAVAAVVVGLVVLLGRDPEPAPPRASADLATADPSPTAAIPATSTADARAPATAAVAEPTATSEPTADESPAEAAETEAGDDRGADGEAESSDYDEVRAKTVAALNARKLSDAERWGRRLVELAPEDAFSYLCLGAALQDQGRVKEALDVYSDCVTRASKGNTHECRQLGGKAKR